MALPHARVSARRAALPTVLLASLCAATPAARSQTAPALPASAPTESHASPAFGTNQPTNQVNSPSIAGQAPAANVTPAPPAKPTLTINHADTVTHDGPTNTDELTGHVNLIYNGYTIVCDRARYDRKTGIVTLENNVSITDGKQLFYADRVVLDQVAGNFTSIAGRTIIPADYVGTALLEPLRLSGTTIRMEGKDIVATDGLVTTCDFPDPHYKIGFVQATIKPNDRIIFRKAVLYRYNRAIFRIDYLSLPIRDDLHYNYLPVVGRTDEEGYFVKNALGYTLGKQEPGILRVDYMQKLGLGLGFDQAYKFGNKIAGTAVVYAIEDKTTGNDELSYHLNHQQIIGDTLTGVQSDYQSNSYLALSTQSVTQNTTINSTRIAGNSTTTASLTLGTNTQGGTYTADPGYDSTLGTTSTGHTENYTLSQSEKFGSTGNVTLKLTGSDSSNSVGSTTQSSTGAVSTATTTSGTIQQSLALTATGRSGIFDMNLSANDELESKVTGTNAGSSTSLYSGPEKLPDLTLTTTSDRLSKLLLPGFFSAVPMNFSFGYGRYSSEQSVLVEQQDGESVSELKNILAARSLFEAGINPKPFEITPGDSLTLQVDGDFKQTVYSSQYAQYVLKQDDTLSQKLGAGSNINLIYGYLRPYGGTPETFTFDQPGSLNNLGTNLTVTGDRIKLLFGTGYDIERARETSLGDQRDPWQTVNGQIALNPSSIIQTRLSGSYDINTGQLNSADDRLRIRGVGGFAVDTDITYDPIHKELSQISASVTTPVFSRDLMLTALTGYDGVTKDFSYKNFTLVRSFHDYEYVFSYHDEPYGFREDRGFNISIRLKAFPFTAGNPTSQYGSSVNLGSGPVF